MDKFTKIVVTIGPSSDSEKIIEKMILHGANVFRFNFKHNTIAWHDERIQRVNRVAKKLGVTVGTLIDLQGPEIRINMPYESMKVSQGDSLIFGQEAYDPKEKGFSISHPQIISHLKNGQRILADDGAFVFHIQKYSGKTYLLAGNSGVLKNRKSLNIPGADFPFPVLVDRDFEGLKLASRNQIDFVALSFVRFAKDITTVRREMKKYNVKGKVIAKIETKKGLSHLQGIIDVSDGIMVARGDMGVELPIQEVPYYQKIIIKEAIKKGIPVITATQMLQSMTNVAYPTRAEVSDIANATYDLTDAVMLSEETAIGKYPIDAVSVMSKTAVFNEKQNKVDSRMRFKFEFKDAESILCDTAYGLYFTYNQINMDIAGFLVFTQTGSTARLLSRYRPLVPIFAFTPDKKTAESLTVNFGVQPFQHKIILKKEVDNTDIDKGVEYLLSKKIIKKSQLLIVLHGNYWAKKGETSTIKLVTV